jgi:hypothetical protein
MFKQTIQQIITLAIADAIINKRAFNLIAFSDGTPTNPMDKVIWMAGKA